MDHDEGYTKELLGLRALGRLSQPELNLVDRHLTDCARCRDELEYVGQAAEYLARFDRRDVDDLLEESEAQPHHRSTDVR